MHLISYCVFVILMQKTKAKRKIQSRAGKSWGWNHPREGTARRRRVLWYLFLVLIPNKNFYSSREKNPNKLVRVKNGNYNKKSVRFLQKPRLDRISAAVKRIWLLFNDWDSSFGLSLLGPEQADSCHSWLDVCLPTSPFFQSKPDIQTVARAAASPVLRGFCLF